jgi:choice-of-anchor A domain-containing protein
VGTKDGSVDACRILVGGCCLLEQKNFFDFESAKSSMIDLSKHFASLPPTTKRFYVDSSETARIVFSGVEIEVINVQAANLFLTSASSIQLSDYAKGAVIVFNVYGKQTGFDAVNMEALKDLPVIFNFPDAETVTVKYTAVRGMILAPYARIEAFSGEIYGKVVAKSYNGGALGISLGASLSCSDGVKYPATCPEPEPAPYEPPLICIDLGIMRQFNGFFWEDVNVASDTQGRLAVGRDAILADGYSVADQLVGVKQCQEATLVVGGTLKWQKGQNYFGNAIVGSVANSQVNKQAVLLNNCCLVEKPDFINFEKSKLKLFEVSRALSLRRSTVTRFDSSSWIVYLSQATDIEVVHMSDLGLSNGNFNRMPTFANYLPNVPIIININGQKVSMSSHDQDSATGLPIYFNFYEAQLLTIRYIAVRGNVLAPYANIQDASGVIWGSVYARSMSGQMQINIGPSAGACPGDDKVLLPEIKCSADGPYGSTSAAPQPVSLKLWWIVYPIIALMISIVKFF